MRDRVTLHKLSQGGQVIGVQLTYADGHAVNLANAQVPIAQVDHHHLPGVTTPL
jgi:hypothetical protein